MQYQINPVISVRVSVNDNSKFHKLQRGLMKLCKSNPRIQADIWDTPEQIIYTENFDDLEKVLTDLEVLMKSDIDI